MNHAVPMISAQAATPSVLMGGATAEMVTQQRTMLVVRRVHFITWHDLLF